MENYFFKVQPTRTFADEVNIERTVVGIAARLTSNIVFALSTPEELNFYIEFLLSTGTKFGGRNVKMSEFVAKAVAGGATEEQAKASIFQVVAALAFGATEQKYAAATGLAQIYGYGLAPVEEQNGNPLYVAPGEPQQPE